MPVSKLSNQKLIAHKMAQILRLSWKWPLRISQASLCWNIATILWQEQILASSEELQSDSSDETSAKISYAKVKYFLGQVIDEFCLRNCQSPQLQFIHSNVTTSEVQLAHLCNTSARRCRYLINEVDCRSSTGRLAVDSRAGTNKMRHISYVNSDLKTTHQVVDIKIHVR